MNQLSDKDYEQILEWLEACTPTLWSLAKAFPRYLQFEEMYQDTFVYLVERYHKLAGKRHPVSYARFCIRLKILNSFAAIREQATLSLDTPNTDDNATLADQLVAKDEQATTTDEEHEDRIRQIVHEALRRQPLPVQQHIKRNYELNDYEPVPLVPYSLNEYYKPSTVAHKALVIMRRDQLLAQQLYG